MTFTEASVHRSHVLAAAAVFLAGLGSQDPGADSDGIPTATDTAIPTETPRPEAAGWSIRFAYDGDRQGPVSVTAAAGDPHQATDVRGTETVEIEARLGIETRAVREIAVTVRKWASDDRTLRVAIRRDGEIIAGGSTDEPRGQGTVTHHV